MPTSLSFVCGTTIRSTGPVPNPAEYLFVSDLDFDSFTGRVQAEDLYMTMSHAFRCSSYGRLHVFWSGMDENPTVYAPES